MNCLRFEVFKGRKTDCYRVERDKNERPIIRSAMYHWIIKSMIIQCTVLGTREIQTFYSALSRLSFEPRLFLNSRVPLGTKLVLVTLRDWCYPVLWSA